MGGSHLEKFWPSYARHDLIVTILYLHTLKHTHKIIAINTRLYVLFYSNTLWNPGFRGIMHLHKKKENLRGPQALTMWQIYVANFQRISQIRMH